MFPDPRNLALEPAAQAFAEATANPPCLYDPGPVEGRKTVDEVQSGEIAKPAVDIEDTTVADVPVRILRPEGVPGTLPVVVYIHGAGWVFGNEHTHDRLVRELADGARAAVATLMAKERGGPSFRRQVLFYPVTDGNFDTGSYEQFADGYFLSRTGMKWFWDQYTTDEKQRAEITASPLRASLEQLTGLPPALVITGEADVLRDEGEAYAAKLRQAGVPVNAVRYQGIIHDFVMLNALRETHAADAAITQAITVLKGALNA
ncbi:alpha/beta hydrolase [Amycolatopsis acidiphila]|uniref:Alpha/beta hydrolase n=1 Tax=Amycolatopsis acidiphila TaxID=715473 RepID=A0A558A8R4_9PSEU|nr:alpha/beta hydrolase [Amycolatopsis acidiphila]TVT20643.1 alpha/beta hydrolase [Amycolatopsis acidiphila]UIJ63781.1 alpha/beta hydrolase [Amycolatopsis acidiphila]